jgi:hypothetical protein
MKAYRGRCIQEEHHKINIYGYMCSSSGRRDIMLSFRPAWGTPSVQYNGYRLCFMVVKLRGVALTTHSLTLGAEFKERV